MAKQVPWNEVIYSTFCKLAMLSDIEKEILRMRIMGYTIIQTSHLLNVSPSTVSRMVAGLKKKYDQVQPYSDDLPLRKLSSQEEYMDNN